MLKNSFVQILVMLDEASVNVLVNEPSDIPDIPVDKT